MRNKSQKPKEDSDPSGVILAASERTEEEEGVFEDLGITDEDKEKSYLAAFLSCWLCKFVFPKDDVTLIRPGVFKVASRMAQGISFGLAIPVLASIYKGLNDISSSEDPGNCVTVLPFHYVYGWLGEYFDTHFLSSSYEKSTPFMTMFSGKLSAKHFEDATARALFRNCDKVAMSRLARVPPERTVLTDAGRIPKEDLAYLVCLRSGYVSLRQENYRVIQPYSPHRFSRQFGYVQHVPGILKDDIWNGTVLSVYSHWKSCLNVGTASTVTLPTKDNTREFGVTYDYVTWWSKVYHFESTKPKTIPAGGRSLSQPKSLKSQANAISIRNKPKTQRAHLEVEGSSTTPAPRVQLLPPANVPTSRASNDLGETESVADSHEDNIPLGQRARTLKRGHMSEDDDVNFRHKKTNEGSLYCDLDASYPLDDTFFCDVPAISQPVLINEGAVVHHVPTVSELVPFNHSPTERINDTLQPINGSGLLAQQRSSKRVHEASTSEMSCGEPRFGVAEKTLRKVVSVLGNQIKNIILKASLERLPSFKDELGTLLTTLGNVGADTSSLRAMIDALMVTAVDYHSAQSAYSQKLSPQVQSDRLAAVDSSLSTVLAQQQAEEVRQSSILESIKSSNARIEELKREQEQLESQFCQLNESLSGSNAQLLHHQSEVTRLREDRATIEETPVLSTADAETLDALRLSFLGLRNGFRELTWE